MKQLMKSITAFAFPAMMLYHHAAGISYYFKVWGYSYGFIVAK
jgi:hypothetical protein